MKTIRFFTRRFMNIILTVFGFSLQGAGQEKLGIYIKSVVKGGAADMVSMKSTTENRRKNQDVINMCECASVCVYTGWSFGGR